MNRNFIRPCRCRADHRWPQLPANAADILYDPPPIYEYEPLSRKAHGGWYLRGYIGMTNQRSALDSSIQAFEQSRHGSRVSRSRRFAPRALIGGGVGYQMNQWLRGDVTVEYRMQILLLGARHVMGRRRNPVNDYRARKSELLFLANAYADLGNYGMASRHMWAPASAPAATRSRVSTTRIRRPGLA
jgi:hypothetical protein